MRPLFFCLARPMKEEWKMRPYLGVLPLVFSALQKCRCSLACLMPQETNLMQQEGLFPSLPLSPILAFQS